MSGSRVEPPFAVKSSIIHIELQTAKRPSAPPRSGQSRWKPCTLRAPASRRASAVRLLSDESWISPPITCLIDEV